MIGLLKQGLKFINDRLNYFGPEKHRERCIIKIKRLWSEIHPSLDLSDPKLTKKLEVFFFLMDEI